jgi:hypothetical protein
MESELLGMNGPIPGENFTSDTKNYPWHRPPDIIDYDEAVDFFIKHFEKKGVVGAIITFLELELDIVSITQMFIMNAIADGRMPIDLGLLVAGPVARHIEIIAKDLGVKYEMGVTGPVYMSAEEIRAMSGEEPLPMEPEPMPMDPMAEPMGEPMGMPSGGLMGAPMAGGVASMGEQEAMLGGGMI